MSSLPLLRGGPLPYTAMFLPETSMHKFLTAALACAVAAIGGTAIAQPSAPARVTGAGEPSVLRTRAARHGLDPAEREARRHALFDRMDADHNGTLTYAEFAAARSRGGFAGAAAGRSRRAQLTAAESLDAPSATPPVARGPRARRSGAARLDANGDGTVTREEYAAAAMQRFDRLDANHDGRITPDERPARRRPAPAAG